MLFPAEMQHPSMDRAPASAPVQRAPPDRPRHRPRKPIRQTRMQPFVRIRRHRFRSSFLYLRRGGISNLRRGARWLPPSQSCTHMHITSSCAKSRWYLSLVAYLMFSSASPTSTTSPLPLMPHLPSASLLVAQIPRLRMHPSPPHASPSSARRMHRLERRAARLERRAGAITVAEGDTRALR